MDDELDPLLEYLLGTSGGFGSTDYMPLYGRSTLGGMIPTRPLEPPEIPSVSASALGQDVGPQEPSRQTMDPYMMYLMSMMGGGSMGRF